MPRIRVSYYDVVGKALAHLPDPEVGRAITNMSATYRAGRADLDFASEVGRAAYAWHLLPAHVSDLTRLLYDLPQVLTGRAALRVLALGAGPGTEALALLEAVSTLKARGDLAELERVEVVRVDRESNWDETCARLLTAAREAVAARRTGLGETWELEVSPQALRCDLTQPLPSDVLAARARADLVIAANLVSEVAPRGTEQLPDGLREAWEDLLAPGQVTTDFLVLDRMNAPGVAGRLEELSELAVEQGGEVEGPVPRQTTCDFALTRRVKALYEHVQLPTTNHEDRPVRSCKTLWLHAFVRGVGEPGSGEG
ncbi:MAG: hypothetical protein AB7N76_23460 [Planctomycetota bacterium]